MSHTQKVKEDTTKMIHSILLASGACSVRTLERDYLSMIGKHIPYQQMGYVNLEAYLRDCPQHFKVFWDGPQMMVKHVTNETTLHIEKMINSQRKKPGKKKAPARMSRPMYGHLGHRMYPKPRNQPPPARLEPVVDSITRGKIRTLLYGYNNGLLGSNFDVAYSRRFGGHVTFKDMGFSSLYNMFKSLTDIVRIEETPAGGYKLYPKTTMKSATSSESEKPKSRSVPPSSHKPVENRSAPVLKKPVEPLLKKEVEPKWNPGPVIADEDLWDDNPYDTSGVNIMLQKEIQQVLAKFPDGVWASEFPAEYRIMFRRELDRRSQGHDSVISLMSVLPHIVSIQRPNQRDWKLYDVRIKQEPKHKPRKDSEKSSSSGPQERSSYSTAPTLDDNMKETIRQVVAHYPEGVLLCELTQVFYDLIGDELNPPELGYATIEALTTSTSLSDTIRLEYNRKSGQVLVFPMREEKPPRKDKLKNLRVVQSIPQVPASSQRKREIPADAVGPGAMYRQQMLPRSILEAEMKYVEVYVSTVTNPSHLWLQLKGEHTTDELERVMDELERVYTDRARADEYTLPEELMTVGQVCAALYPNDGDWHRCTITGFRDLDFVEVYYVDYGSSYVLTKKSLKFLQMRFLKLPAQGLKAKLANVQPVNGGEWTKASKDRLLNLVSNRPLIALVTEISQENELSVCLTDTSTEKDVHINDLLVVEKLAEMAFPALELPEEETYEESKPSSRPQTISMSRSDPASIDGERNIRYIQLTDEYCVHLIKYDDKPHVTSFEISNLLWPGKDVLRSMMRQKKLTLPKIIIPREDHKLLFEEFQMCEVGGTLDTEGSLKTHVTVFDLSSVVDILDTFSHPSEQLKAAVQQQIDLFNPHDGYWKGEGESDLEEDVDSDEDDDDDDFKYGRQTLEMALQSLQFRRKKILQAMQDANLSNPVRLVEDLQKVEHQLGDIKKRIKELERLEKAEGSVKSTDSKKMTEEEELVCAVVSEQNDSYVEKNAHDGTSKAVPQSPTARVTPLQTSTPRSGIKTAPVAPMPAEPRPTTSTATSITSAQPIGASLNQMNSMMGMSLGSDVSTPLAANNSMMLMPFAAGGGGGGGDTSDLLHQQLLLQYQYNMLAMQSMLQPTTTSTTTTTLDPSAILMQQQAALAAQMQSSLRFPLGSSSFGRGGGFGQSYPLPGQGMGSSLGLGNYFGGVSLDGGNSTSRLLGQGRGRCVSDLGDMPGGLQSKKQ